MPKHAQSLGVDMHGGCAWDNTKCDVVCEKMTRHATFEAAFDKVKLERWSRCLLEQACLSLRGTRGRGTRGRGRPAEGTNSDHKNDQ